MVDEPERKCIRCIRKVFLFSSVDYKLFLILGCILVSSFIVKGLC